MLIVALVMILTVYAEVETVDEGEADGEVEGLAVGLITEVVETVGIGLEGVALGLSALDGSGEVETGEEMEVAGVPGVEVVDVEEHAVIALSKTKTIADATISIPFEFINRIISPF